MKRKNLILPLIIVSVLLLGYYSFSRIYKFLTTVETGENISNVQHLPSWLKEYLSPHAEQISYYKQPSFYTAYEYSISEKHFLAWAKEKDIPLKTIDNQPEEINRYTFFVNSEADRTASIAQGYQYQIIYDNGGGVHIVYDSSDQMAYHSVTAR